MNETKVGKLEAKPQGYVLTKKGEQAASKTGKWVNSMDDVILRVMAKSPDAPLTKDTLADDLWQKASQVLAKLEEEGLVKKADSDAGLRKPRVVVDDSFKPSKLSLPRTPKPKVQRLTKDVYSDKRGQRLARKRRRGWDKVTY